MFEARCSNRVAVVRPKPLSLSYESRHGATTGKFDSRERALLENDFDQNFYQFWERKHRQQQRHERCGSGGR